MRERIGVKGLISDDARFSVSFNQRGREYRAENPMARRVLCYKVDGGVIEDGERCDFALGIPSFEVVCLIELKGKDLKKAASQILSTIQILGNKIEPYVIHGRIVLSRVSRPDLRSSVLIQLERTLAQRGGTVRRSTNIMEENIEFLVT
jgi:hypothetical protein